MSNIPKARKFIDQLIEDIEAGVHVCEAELIWSLKEVKTMLYRKPPIRKAEPQSAPMTPELAAAIRAFANRNQQMTFQSIGQRFNVNAGRVTEVLQSDQGDIV